MKKLLSILVKLILAVVLLVVVLLSALSIFKVPVDLTRFRGPLEVLASKALARQVRINESVVVSTSLSPNFTLRGLQIENPEIFSTEDFLTMDLVNIQVELLPLFKRKVHIADIQVHGLNVTLEEAPSGEVNWIFGTPGSVDDQSVKPAEPAPDPRKKTGNTTYSGDSIAVKKLDLKEIHVELHRPGLESAAHYDLHSCQGSMVPGQPMKMVMFGSVPASDYRINVTIASLEELLEESRSWMDISANIADTEFAFSGNIDLRTSAQTLTLQTVIQGKNLSSLSNLLRIDLPPFADYKVETALRLQPGAIELEKLLVRTGASSLEGRAAVIKDDEMKVVDVNLHAPLVQIDDFVFANWSWTGEDAAAEEGSDSSQTAEEDVSSVPDNSSDNMQLLAPNLLKHLQMTLAVESDMVLSGSDELGSGRVAAQIQNGLIEVDPLVIALPGGKIEMMSSLSPGKEGADASLKVVMRNFDIGLLVRRTKPESTMGGLINLDIDMQSSASSIDELLANGNGHFDFSGDLENLKAGIIDLWAVNLVSAIVRSAEKEKSELNCAVGRWSVTDGLLHSDAFFIDTSRMRICVDGKVDFTEKRIDLAAKPKAKKPEFFSLATPLEIHGSFSDINIDLGGGGVVGTAIKFLASPVSVPIRRTFSDKIPEDGSDVCGMALGPENRENLHIPMCTD